MNHGDGEVSFMCKWHVGLYKHSHWPTAVLDFSDMSKASIWVCHYDFLEYPFAYPCMHSRYLDFDIWCRNSLFIILNMTILSPQWGMVVSVKAERVATYIFQSKKYSKNGFFENEKKILSSTNISCGQTLENFICKWIYQMFLSPNAFIVCPVGEGGGPVTEWEYCFRAAESQALSSSEQCSSEQELACSTWARKGMHIPCVLGNSPLEQSNLQSQLISEHNFMPCLEKGKKKKKEIHFGSIYQNKKIVFLL